MFSRLFIVCDSLLSIIVQLIEVCVLFCGLWVMLKWFTHGILFDRCVVNLLVGVAAFVCLFWAIYCFSLIFGVGAVGCIFLCVIMGWLCRGMG